MKKVLSVILVLAVLMMALASCGGGRKKVDISGAKSLADVNGSGAVIAAQSGTFHLQALNDQMSGVQKKEYKDFTALLMALKSGSIDGYIAEEPTAFTASLKDDTISYLPLVNNKTGFAVTGDDTGIAVAFKKGSPLVEKVNTILDAVSEDIKLQLMNQIFDINKDTTKELNTKFALTSSNTDTSNGTLKISMECAYDPFNWTQTTAANGAVPIKGSSNTYANGYDVQVAKYIAAELGMSLEIVANEWDSLIPAVQSGAVDGIIAGMSPTEERMQEVDFTHCYYRSNLVIIFNK